MTMMLKFRFHGLRQFSSMNLDYLAMNGSMFHYQTWLTKWSSYFHVADGHKLAVTEDCLPGGDKGQVVTVSVDAQYGMLGMGRRLMKSFQNQVTERIRTYTLHHSANSISKFIPNSNTTTTETLCTQMQTLLTERSLAVAPYNQTYDLKFSTPPPDNEDFMDGSVEDRFEEEEPREPWEDWEEATEKESDYPSDDSDEEEEEEDVDMDSEEEEDVDMD